MASINTGRVVAGGLVAGLVANAIDFVTNTYVMADDWTAFAQAHNMDPAAMTSPAVAGTWVIIDFLLVLGGVTCPASCATIYRGVNAALPR